MGITEQNLKLYDRILGTTSEIAIIVGGFWTLWEFLEAKQKENALLKQQIELNIFNDKKAVYTELCDAEAEITACDTYMEVVAAQKHFWKLYFGRAHIIAQLDTAVNNQKIDFGHKLDDYITNKTAETPADWFGPSALDLAELCRKHLDVSALYYR